MPSRVLSNPSRSTIIVNQSVMHQTTQDTEIMQPYQINKFTYADAMNSLPFNPTNSYLRATSLHVSYYAFYHCGSEYLKIWTSAHPSLNPIFFGLRIYQLSLFIRGIASITSIYSSPASVTWIYSTFFYSDICQTTHTPLTPLYLLCICNAVQTSFIYAE